MLDNPNRSIAIFAAVFFVLTLISGAGFFGAVGSTVIASAVVWFAMRYFAAKRVERGPPR